MAFVIAGAARLTYSSVRAAIDAHHDVAHGLEPTERFDRWGDKKDQHPVYGFVRRAEERWRDRKGKGRASASEAAKSLPTREEAASQADLQPEMTMAKKDEPVAVIRAGDPEESAEDDLPGYNSDSTPLGLPSPAYIRTEREMPVLPSAPSHEPLSQHVEESVVGSDSTRPKGERRLLAA